MDLFRSRKRDIEEAAFENANNQKKRMQAFTGSLDDLLNLPDDNDTVSEKSSSDSENDENINVASRQQKMFAKKSIKREKKKEKELRKKVEKNIISMDDFLGKQSEFKMWLYEEKSKNAGEMSSPKLKTHFKNFIRQWNKKKLPGKYYRGVSQESPAPLTPTKMSFMSESETNSNVPLKVSAIPSQDEHVDKVVAPSSPFITFGKTPPKVFRTKKFPLNVHGATNDVKLISVAPLDSPRGSMKREGNMTDSEASDHKSTRAGAVPYKVSTLTYSTIDLDDDNQLWPPPPSEAEILGGGAKPDKPITSSDSPHIAPPPPPRKESLKKRNINSTSSNYSPKLDGNYSDPYDTLPRQAGDGKSSDVINTEYREPVDCVKMTKTMTSLSSLSSLINHDYAELGLISLPPQNEEPDLSLYSAPIQPLNRFTEQSMYVKPNKTAVTDENIEDLYAKPNKKAARIEDIENLYAKPVKKAKREEVVAKDANDSDLYTEIMEHIKGNTSRSEEGREPAEGEPTNRHLIGQEAASRKPIEQEAVKREPVNKWTRPEPDYESIDDLMPLVAENTSVSLNGSSTSVGLVGTKLNGSSTSIDGGNSNSGSGFQMNPTTKFASLSRSKKRTVMAASTEQIYQTYLSYGKKKERQKAKMAVSEPEDLYPLKQKCKSQPDVTGGNELKSFKLDFDKNAEGVESNCSSKAQTFSSFKPANDNDIHTNTGSNKRQAISSPSSFHGTFKELDTPWTPVIMATPSFESLCDAKTTSMKSGSLHSLPSKASGSSESIDSKSCMSISSASSTLSFCPGDNSSGSLQSLQSGGSLSPVREETETGYTDVKPPKVAPKPTSRRSTKAPKSTSDKDSLPPTGCQRPSVVPKPASREMHSSAFATYNQTSINMNNQVPVQTTSEIDMKPIHGNTNAVMSQDSCSKIDNVPLTPGKINASKLGIDLSRYLLKPSQGAKGDNAVGYDSGKGDNAVGNDAGIIKSSGSCSEENEQLLKNRRPEVELSDQHRPLETSRGSTGPNVPNKQSRLAFKDTLSGVRTTKVDHCKHGSKRVTDIVKTPEALRAAMNAKKVQVPSIGIAAKTRKKDSIVSSTKQAVVAANQRAGVGLKDGGGLGLGVNKRARDEVLLSGHHYLETDLDTVTTEPPRQPMKKSKSMGDFTSSMSNTVTTDIW